jgi:hypothetical protein
VAPLSEEIDTNGVETQETVDERAEVWAFVKMPRKCSNSKTDVSSQYSKHGGIE